MIRQIALISQSKELNFSELTKGTAALLRQATRDLGRSWNIEAIVAPFSTIEEVPVGYWPILVVDALIFSGAAGYHTDEHGQPFALVEFSGQWTLAASHEMIEMLIDPFGATLVPGQSLDPNNPGRVRYLVEACDPCEDPSNAYSVNGYLVSDFYTPRYFDPAVSQGVQYSVNGKISKPRELLPGGYITWHNMTENTWYQATYFGEFTIRKLGSLQTQGKSLRERVDRLTRPDANGVFRTPAVAEIAKRESVGQDGRASKAFARMIQKAIEILAK